MENVALKEPLADMKSTGILNLVLTILSKMYLLLKQELCLAQAANMTSAYRNVC